MILGPSTSATTVIIIKNVTFEKIMSEYSLSNYNASYRATPQFHIGGGRFPSVAVYATGSGYITLECALSGDAVQ